MNANTSEPKPKTENRARPSRTKREQNTLRRSQKFSEVRKSQNVRMFQVLAPPELRRTSVNFGERDCFLWNGEDTSETICTSCVRVLWFELFVYQLSYCMRSLKSCVTSRFRFVWYCSLFRQAYYQELTCRGTCPSCTRRTTSSSRS